MEADFGIDTDLTTQSLLLAAAHHDVPALRDLLRNTSANVQDPDTGFTPLHAAIAAFEPDQDEDTAEKPNGQSHGDGVKVEPNDEELEQAVKTIKLLLQNGAIWNDLDSNNETPGCIADRLGLKELYDLMVDAGVRAELLLNRLDDYQPLGDQDDSEDEGEDEDEDEESHVEQNVIGSNNGGEPVEVSGPDVQRESEVDVSSSNTAYLSNPVNITQNQILDRSTNGVMMSWERPVMERSAKLLAPTSRLRILNVGHGMGIIDNVFQETSPSEHHIIEAHPDIIARLRTEGWYGKQGVVVHERRWQDVAPKLVAEGITFDAIYFDTFAEEYKALREFFSEYVIGLLDAQGGGDNEGGRFGFFNGMGGDRQVCYDVYNKVVEMDLFESGFDVEWENIDIPDLSAAGEWDRVKRSYFNLRTYRLPTCKFMP